MSAWLIAASPAHAQTRENAGVTDEFLVSLGTAAENHLTTALNDRAKEDYALGLVLRLETIGYIDEPNPRIFRALKIFIERQAKRNGDIGKTIEALYRAFDAIGRRGGDEGTDYLISWVVDSKKIEGVRAYRWTTVEESREKIFKSAVRGLGLVGSDKAETALKALFDSDIPLKYEDWRSDVESALELNKRVKKDPLEGRYMLSELKKMGLSPIYIRVHEKAAIKHD